MRELDNTELEASEQILKIMAGFTVEQAEAILRTVKKMLKERAVIE